MWKKTKNNQPTTLNSAQLHVFLVHYITKPYTMNLSFLKAVLENLVIIRLWSSNFLHHHPPHFWSSMKVDIYMHTYIIRCVHDCDVDIIQRWGTMLCRPRTLCECSGTPNTEKTDYTIFHDGFWIWKHATLVC